MNTHNRIDIACAIDDGFSYPLTGMIVSCLENHKEHNVHIHLFSAGLSGKTVSFFEDLVKSYGQKFRFYRLTEDQFKDFPINDRISRAAYYRILMPDTIDEEVDRFLYLDADIIVVKPLDGLFSIDLEEEYFLAAVHDLAAIQQDMHLKHKIPEEYLYFNSGVLLIDRSRWIANDATDTVLDYIKKNIEICTFHDQDGLNGALYANRKELSPVYNQQVGIFYIDKQYVESVFGKQLDATYTSPVIVHFNGFEKPWNYVSGHPYKKKFREYAKKGIHLKKPEKITLKKIIRKHLINGLYGWERRNREIYKRQLEIEKK